MTESLVRCRLKWAVHIERMGGEQLAKKADTRKVDGERRQGSLRLRWEDCFKRDFEGLGEGWRRKAKERGEWRRFVGDSSKKAVRGGTEKKGKPRNQGPPHRGPRKEEESNNCG